MLDKLCQQFYKSMKSYTVASFFSPDFAYLLEIVDLHSTHDLLRQYTLLEGVRFKLIVHRYCSVMYHQKLRHHVDI